MSNRAYIARVELEYIVVASSENAAKKMAIKEFRNDSCVVPEDFELGPFSHVPATYEMDSEIQTDDGAWLTIEQASKLPGGYDETGSENAAKLAKLRNLHDLRNAYVNSLSRTGDSDKAKDALLKDADQDVEGSK